MLDDNNIFFVYNSARQGYPSQKSGWTLQYNVGYVILEGKNPLNIIARSEQPILEPLEDWENG